MTLLNIRPIPEPTPADLELLRRPLAGPPKRTGTLLALALLPESEAPPQHLAAGQESKE